MTLALALILGAPAAAVGLACWAPPDGDGVAPTPPPDDTPTPSPTPPPSPLPAPVVAPEAPITPVAQEPGAVRASSAEELPAAPFTAWTAESPLTVVGPGGVQVAVLRRLGVRVEVLQVLDARIRIRCDGCGEEPAPEGWVNHDTLRAADSHGSLDDPLSRALRLRAAWAGRRDLPADADPASLCALIDHGFELEPTRARWSHATGLLDLRWVVDDWVPHTTRNPVDATSWSCRTTRPTPAGPPPP